MVREFNEETTTYEEGKDLLVSTAPILIRLESVESAKSMGEGRCKIIMTSGREYVLRNSYEQVSNSIQIANNK